MSVVASAGAIEVKETKDPLMPPAISSDDQQKEITNREIIENLKAAIKPVELKDAANENVVIRYESPRQTLRTTLGDPSVPSDLNLVVSKDDDTPEQFQDIVVQAYKAALLGQFEASVYLYKKALEKEPENINVMYGLGSLYQKLHQNDQAQAMYKKVLTLEPRHQNALNNYMVLMAAGSPKNALIELNELEKSNPDFSPVQAQIGMVLAQIGDYPAAERHLRKAVLLSPEIVNYRYNLAVVYDHMGAYENAINMYKQVLKFHTPDEPLPQKPEYIQARLDYLQAFLIRQHESAVGK
jgi:tetratricopeptide (TPR) repeat protein